MKLHKDNEAVPECSICKSIMKLGFDINSSNLPVLCIRYCGRWGLIPH
ncbi:MAG: hypothetical protein KKD39_07580 [Candidatus Altiarchaeota archaeon]|nr:hypothetical protein [Candidatus Altiarchaeota archaeon]